MKAQNRPFISDQIKTGELFTGDLGRSSTQHAITPTAAKPGNTARRTSHS